MRKLTDEAQDLYASLKEQLALAWKQPGPAFQNADAAAMLCQEALQKLKECHDRRPPCSAEKKIHFFKTIKPLFVAEQLYYNKLYLLHLRWPPGGEETEREYLREWLRKGYSFFEEHKDFCMYLRACRTDRDAYYFIPGRRPAWQMPPDDYWNVTDAFTSGYDMIVGRMLANERLQEYLLDKLHNNKCGNAGNTRRHLPWSKTKMAVMELIYGFEGTCAINNGQFLLKEMVEAFEDLFQIDLGNYSDTLRYMRARKGGMTPFLDEMKAALLRKLDEDQ